MGKTIQSLESLMVALSNLTQPQRRFYNELLDQPEIELSNTISGKYAGHWWLEFPGGGCGYDRRTCGALKANGLLSEVHRSSREIVYSARVVSFQNADMGVEK